MTHDFIIYEPTILIGIDLAETLHSHAPEAQVVVCHDPAALREAIHQAAEGTTAILHLGAGEAALFDLARGKGLRVVLLDVPGFALPGKVAMLPLPFDPAMLRAVVFPGPKPVTE